jgi:HlyD family secretion protein
MPDYLPDALEVELRRPPPLARATLRTLAAMLGLAVIAAAVMEVDRVVVAGGKLATTAPTIVVQPLETSVVRSIDVRIGDRVAKGAPLGAFDPTFAAADVNQLQAEADMLTALIARLEAELAGDDFAPPADAGPEVKLQQEIFRRRRLEYRAKLEGMNATIARLEHGIGARKADIAMLRERLSLISEVERIRSTLFQQQQGSKLHLLEANDSKLQVNREMGVADREIVEYGLDLTRARAEREGYLNEWRREAAVELADALRRREGAINQLDKARRRSAMVAMTSPADAVVLDIAKRSVGSVVREAEPFFTLVPLDVPLEAEVEVEARDIGHVRAGAPVKIKLDAYPYQRHGMLEGKVRTVSEDAFTRDAATRAPGQGGAAFYRARVDLTTTTLAEVPADFRLLPGLTLSAEIHAGYRTVLSYLLHPLTRGLSESMREP